MATPVLVVDDSAMSRKMIVKALPQDWDIEVTHASNGIEALEAYYAGKADVMLLDLTMPGMDGYELLETLKQEGLKSFVVVVSADIQPKTQTRVKELGALAFLKKPLNTDELKAVLREHGLL